MEKPNQSGSRSNSAPNDKDMLHAVVDTVVDGIIVIDRKGVVQSANLAATTIFGYAVEEMVGRNVKILMPEPYHREHDGHIERYHRTGRPKIIGVRGRELMARRKDGSSFPIELGVSATELDGADLYVGIVRDITERKRAENLTEQLKQVMGAVVDGLITIDECGRISAFNPAAERIFGYSAEEVFGENVKMLMPEPYHGEHDEYLESYRRTGVAKIIGIGREVRARRKSGEVFPIDLAVSEMNVFGRRMYVGIVRDISERKRSEEEREKLIESLRVSNQELDDFAYIASHDMKEPLRGIHNNAMFLCEDYEGKLDTEGMRRLDRMRFLCSRLESLIDDLLYFSRIGRQSLAIQEVDLNQVVAEISEMLESILEERNARIEVPKTLPLYVCDAVRVKEVFRNLISNAIKYNDSEVKRVEVGYLETWAGLRDVFYVKDNGYGIDPAYHDEIFRIFKRLNMESDADRGTGSGLTFVRKIVERHSGSVWLESVPEEGSTFFFTLKPQPDLNDQ